MKKRPIPLIAVMLAACALTLVVLSRRSPASSAAPAHTPAPAQAMPMENTAPLFPGIDRSAALCMSICAADRAFEFERTGSFVSVNGHKADGDILETLIEQVMDMPIAPRDAFSPAETPMMTIVVASGGAEHTAAFYRSPQEGSADVLYTHRSGQYYGVTDAWRVGTLLLTCDGTRILDAGGNEAPIQE